MSIYCDLKSRPDVLQNVVELSKYIDSSAAYAAIMKNNGYSLDKTPEGKVSGLYNQLLETFNDKQKALEAKSKIYSSEFIDRFGDWVSDGKEPSIFDLNLTRFNQDIDSYKQVLKTRLQKWLDKEKPHFWGKAVKEFNEYNGTNFGQFRGMVTEKGLVIKGHPYYNDFKDRIERNRVRINSENLETLVDYLKGKFPNLKIQILDYKTFSIYAQQQVKDDRKINSFIKGDTVYIDESVATEDMILEEVLHPTINQLKLLNPELFNGLFQEALNTFPKLAGEISAIYDSNQDEELVTQVLSRYLRKELHLGKNRNTLKDYLEKVAAWIKEQLQDLFGEFDSKLVSLRALDFLENCTFKDLAEIINALEVTMRDEWDPSARRFNLEDNIVITSPLETRRKALEINGIDTLRHPDAEGMHFGNPFTHLTNQPNTIHVSTVKEAVNNYEAWLRGTDFKFVEPERRAWIFELIKNGSLVGKPLVYYTENIPDESYGLPIYNPQTAPNHAHILLKLINEYDPNKQYVFKNDNELKLYDLLRHVTGSDELFKSFILGDSSAQLQVKKITLNWQQRLLELLHYGYAFPPLAKIISHYDFDNYFRGHNINEEFTPEEATNYDPVSNYQVVEAEAIIPKLYKTNFKLGNHTLFDIDLNFFKKVNPFYKSVVQGTDFLVRLHDKRFNIVVNDDLSFTGTPVKINRSEDGYRLDSDGNKLYKLPENSAVFQDQFGNETVVLQTEGIERNLQTLLATTKNIVSVLPFLTNIQDFELGKKLAINILNNNVVKTLNRAIRDSVQTAVNLRDLIQKLDVLYKDPESKRRYSRDLSSSLYNSFLKTMHIISARIPTQALQSFMPMRIVAFTGSEGNDVFVSRWLLWLQGSDMDIKR